MCQPLTASGELYDGNVSKDVFGYRGVVGFVGFKAILKVLKIDLQSEEMDRLWNNMSKDPWEIESVLYEKVVDPRGSRYLRLGMDLFGVDPMKGGYVLINSLREQLRLLMTTGLPMITLYYLLKSELNLDVTEARIDAAVQTIHHRRNEYGLIRYDDVPNIIIALDSRGLDFDMLRDLIKDMKLNISEDNVLTMFNKMDVNGDYALSLNEILAGFEALYYLFLPNRILHEMKLSAADHLRSLLLIFFSISTSILFLILSIASFEGMRGGADAIVQAILMVAGAG